MGPVSFLDWAPIIGLLLLGIVSISMGIVWAWPYVADWVGERRRQRLAAELAETQRQLWLAEQALSHELRTEGLEARKALIRESLVYGRDQAVRGGQSVRRRPR